MGKLKINSSHSDKQFDYTEGNYILRGNAQTDVKTTVMTSFNASVYKTDSNDMETNIGNVSTNYDQSKGEDGLNFNVYNMGISDLIAVAPIIKECAEALASNEGGASSSESAE